MVTIKEKLRRKKEALLRYYRQTSIDDYTDRDIDIHNLLADDLE
jgi:CRISPR/Cas system Type II protein with McrA/HNH and RuvC-like nuclease domain